MKVITKCHPALFHTYVISNKLKIIIIKHWFKAASGGLLVLTGSIWSSWSPSLPSWCLAERSDGLLDDKLTSVTNSSKNQRTCFFFQFERWNLFEYGLLVYSSKIWTSCQSLTYFVLTLVNQC